MNTKWEEDFKEISTLWVFDKIEWENAKVFIKDQITKAQQEIAEQIIDDIKLEYEGCQGCSCDSVDDLEQLKQQLRKKYL